jgi:hypothetical protein
VGGLARRWAIVAEIHEVSKFYSRRYESLDRFGQLRWSWKRLVRLVEHYPPALGFSCSYSALPWRALRHWSLRSGDELGNSDGCRIQNLTAIAVPIAKEVLHRRIQIKQTIYGIVWP